MACTDWLTFDWITFGSIVSQCLALSPHSGQSWESDVLYCICVYCHGDSVCFPPCRSSGVLGGGVNISGNVFVCV